jgi:hypothetical protein
MTFEDIDLAELRRVPGFAHYFRYPLRHRDFREVRIGGRLRGRYAAKPLYGRLTPDGKVDRSAGFNGDIAIVLIPSRARTAKAAKLLLAHLDPSCVALPDGRRNWPAIRTAAERRLASMFEE